MNLSAKFVLPKGYHPSNDIALLASMGMCDDPQRYEKWRCKAAKAEPTFLFAVGLRFYVASRLENLAQAALLVELLKREGHQCTYDWTAHGRVWQPDVSDYENRIKMAKVSDAEAEGIAQAEVVVVWLPGGRGTHTELGMALALKKPVVLCSAEPVIKEQGPCAFYFHPGVMQCVTEVQVGERMRRAVAAVRSLTVELRRPKTELRPEWRIGDLPMSTGLLSGLIDGSSEPEAYT